MVVLLWRRWWLFDTIVLVAELISLEIYLFLIGAGSND